MIFVTHDQDEAMSLGDKIVVMNDGTPEQIGTPYEIYNQPQTIFVAEFIGSPNINLFECRVRDSSDDTILESSTFEITVSGSTAKSLTQHVGDTITVGIRPEDIKITDSGLFEAEVTLTEPHGSNEVVYLDAGETEVRMETEQGVLQEAQQVNISFETGDMVLFNPDGERIV